MKMDYDENMKVGDFVKVRRGASRGPDYGIVLSITRDRVYKDIERYHVHYFSSRKGTTKSQWANHIEVISSCKYVT